MARNQVYRLNQLKTRKAKVILAAIRRECGGEASVTTKIIKSRINNEIHSYYRIRTMEEVPEQNFEQCRRLIEKYRFRYLGREYG